MNGGLLSYNDLNNKLTTGTGINIDVNNQITTTSGTSSCLSGIPETNIYYNDGNVNIGSNIVLIRPH
jgi:hypothetical protein